MKENLTELVFILDRSGSMHSMANEAVGGFNSFLEEQKKCPGDAKLTLVLFDHEYQLVHNGKNIQEIEPLCTRTYAPRGTTALIDAVGRTIDDVGKRLSETPERDRPSKILVAILTDGLENASRDYDKKRIREMISHQQNKYSWKFVFLASNQDAFSEATKIGISGNLSLNYACSAVGYKDAFTLCSEAATSYRRSGKLDNLRQSPIVPDINVDTNGTTK